MSRVDFYVLGASGARARDHFACRLAEKAWRAENQVFIRVASADAARQLDDMLWTFRDGSFVPHDIVGTGTQPAPISIGTELPDGPADLLINLTDAVPGDAGSFARVAEIVTSDDDAKARSRQRFSAYRDAGHELQTHKLQ